MTENQGLSLPADTGTVCYLTSEDQVGDIADELQDRCDDRKGIQARMALRDVTTDEAFDRILRTAKDGSRRGKNLEDTYREAVTDRVENLEESEALSGLEEWYESLDTDAYEAELTADALGFGFDIIEAVQEKLDGWSDLTFDKADLAAATNFTQPHRADRDVTHCVVVESDTPVSTLRDQNKLGTMVQVLTELEILGFTVAVVVPKGQQDEERVIRETFRKVGSLEIRDNTGTEIEITDAVEAFVKEWYDRLCYDVSGGSVNERVVQSASVTLYDLPEAELAEHFTRAIDEGLLRKYSEKKYKRDRFDELRRGRITEHPNYDRFRSRYTEFPTVKIAREDGITREFRLHHQGIRASPHLDGTQLDDESPERALVDVIERFLDAEKISADRWTERVETARNGIARHPAVDAERLVSEALLHRSRKMTDIPPLVSQQDPTSQKNGDTDMYDEQWKPILSGYEITSSGTNIIAEKQELKQSLKGASVADSVLYHKLQRDIDNAWEVYIDGLTTGVRRSVPDEYDLDITAEEMPNGTRLVFAVDAGASGQLETAVDIHLPYSDVRLEGTQISKARVSNAVSAVVSTFEELLYDQTSSITTSRPDADLLYEVVTFYIQITDCEAGDRVYFDDIAEFCRRLPGVTDRLDRPDSGANDARIAMIDSPDLVETLRDADATTHLKGADNHGYITDRQEKKITSFDITDRLI